MRIVVYILSGLFQFFWWFYIALVLCGDVMAIFLPPKTGLDNVPFILGLHNQFELLRSPTKVNHLHVICDLNGVLVAKRA